MGATTSPSPDARIARFSRAERWVHRSITVLMIVLIATAAALYFPDVSVLVGNRPIVSNIHVIAGFVPWNKRSGVPRKSRSSSEIRRPSPLKMTQQCANCICVCIHVCL